MTAELFLLLQFQGSTPVHAGSLSHSHTVMSYWDQAIFNVSFTNTNAFFAIASQMSAMKKAYSKYRWRMCEGVGSFTIWSNLGSLFPTLSYIKNL